MRQHTSSQDIDYSKYLLGCFSYQPLKLWAINKDCLRPVTLIYKCVFCSQH